MKIVALVSDLLDQSKIKNALAAHDVVFEKTASDDPAADLYLIDLRRPTALEEIKKLADQVTLGFGSHVDVERMEKASEVGCTMALPRSRFFAHMNDVVLEATAKSESDIGGD